MKKGFHVGVAATGMVLPSKCYTNDDVLAEINKATEGRDDVPELNSKWIEENIWIKTRYYFSEDETMLDVSTKAVNQALLKAGWDPLELDFVILSSTSTRSDKCSSAIPSLACRVQEKLKAYNAFAYDTAAACSGWVYAASQAIAFIESGVAQKGAVICVEKQRVGLDYSNHRSSILIGDVAAATLFEKQVEPKITSLYMRANDEKNLSNIIRLPFHRYENDRMCHGHFALEGRSVFKEGVGVMTRLTQLMLSKNELSVDDIDWFIYHQANGAMLRMVGRKVGMKDERNLMNIQQLANTTAGTIPSVLHMNIENGTIKRGDKVCCIAFGGGLTSGSVIFDF
jgi:3-oxoacyl-[acyl-carrier-protein] synthase III